MLTGNVTGCLLIKSRYLAYTHCASVNQRRIQLGGNRGGKSIIGENDGLPLVLHVERFSYPRQGGKRQQHAASIAENTHTPQPRRIEKGQSNPACFSVSWLTGVSWIMGSSVAWSTPAILWVLATSSILPRQAQVGWIGYGQTSFKSNKNQPIKINKTINTKINLKMSVTSSSFHLFLKLVEFV